MGWNAIANVTSGFTLIAFVVAAIASILRGRLKTRERQLLAAPEEDRAALIQALNDNFLVPSLPVDPTSLGPAKAYALLLEQIRDRTRRYYVTAILVFLIALVTAGVAFYALSRPEPHPGPQPTPTVTPAPSPTATTSPASTVALQPTSSPAPSVSVPGCECESGGTVDHPFGSCTCMSPGEFSWPRPQAVHAVRVVGCGGGGGGGQAGGAGHGGQDNAGGGGGGEGAAVYSIRVSGLLGPSYRVRVGAGGRGGSGQSSSPGGDGQPSAFENPGGAPFQAAPLSPSDPALPPLMANLVFAGGFGGRGGAYAFQGGGPGAGGSGGLGADGGQGHGPVSAATDASGSGESPRLAAGGRGVVNCQVNGESGGSGGGGGAAYGAGGTGGCGGGYGKAEPGRDGGQCAGGGGGGGFGENQIAGMPGGNGGGGLVLISWGEDGGGG